MRKEIFQFLKIYSCDVNKTNRLLVSAFLRSKKIEGIANTLIKSLIIDVDDSDYYKLMEFEEKFSIDSIEVLETAFEFVISPSEKVVTGAIYTPKEIRCSIITNVFSNFDNIADLTLCDPACGCAGFLVNAAMYIKENTSLTYKTIFSDCLYGLDLKDYSIERSKIILSLLAIINKEDEVEFDFNLYIGNALNFDWEGNVKDFSKFDIVVGNPPYVSSRHIDIETKKLCKSWHVSSIGHPDLYIPFFEIGHSLLKSSGVLGYITMNTFFKSMNGRYLRKYFSSNNLCLSIFDFGSKQVFDSRNTYTCICILTNEKSDTLKYMRISSAVEINESTPKSLFYHKLDDQQGWNLLENDAINKIETTGRPFSEVFRTSSGIATLRNNFYIFNPSDEDSLYFYLDDGTPIEKGICLNVINSNKLTVEKSIDSLKQKLIFPYYYNEDKAIPLEEDYFSVTYPCAYNYLLSKKYFLSLRDKGRRKYPKWFAYGRSQALDKVRHRLFFPHIAAKTPNFILSSDSDLLFYNGLALISSNKRELLLAKKIMESKVFWFYVTRTSKPYNSGFYSISRNYIKCFGIPCFTPGEIDLILNESCKEKIDEILLNAYGLANDLLENY
ncbi:N-6 DNA methylase [uncultured Amphritea sp.]|uniref:Eco57I restriction-modification methylase domain-containing protein n=1 Tax=uncultured Amphritea sp. TaxID=981605 RepID=UPI0025EE10E9|nr:N-6 DNA methylase [uncultured Amphritea sp.]